jgi:cystathionine gamma-synthase
MTSERMPSADTLAVWAGEVGEARWHGSTQVPIALGVASAYADVDEWLDVATGEAPGYIYNRNTNPTVRAFEEKVRQLEGAAACISFASGMAAISNTLMTLLRPHDHVVSVKDSYGGTSKLFLEILPRFNITCTLCDTTDHAALEAEIACGCRVLYLETPTNPTLKVTDIARLARAAHAVGATVVVDNTFATPLNQQPLTLGADLVVHSASKFLGGHADALGGVLCGDAALVQQVYQYREITGAALDPHAAYLLLRGLKTLHLRVERQCASALRIAHYLESHPAVAAVYYPGLASHPQHKIATAQMQGFGGMLSFELHGGFEAVKAFLPRLRYAHRAANLGAVETIVGPPATTSHVELTAAQRAKLGIPEGLVRYSAGIEDIDDLLADLQQALG